jgi:hypothetical protein
MTNLPGCHRCGATPLFQWARKATAEEAARQREQLAVLHGRELSAEEVATIHGPLREAVTGCAEHHLVPEAADDSYEAATAAFQAGAERRTWLHDADCGGHGNCGCTGAP